MSKSAKGRCSFRKSAFPEAQKSEIMQFSAVKSESPGTCISADGAMIGGQSGVNGDIPPKSYMRGTPPRPYLKAHKTEILIGHLAELFDRVKDLEKHLGISKKTFGSSRGSH